MFFSQFFKCFSLLGFPMFSYNSRKGFFFFWKCFSWRPLQPWCNIWHSISPPKDLNLSLQNSQTLCTRILMLICVLKWNTPSRKGNELGFLISQKPVEGVFLAFNLQINKLKHCFSKVQLATELLRVFNRRIVLVCIWHEAGTHHLRRTHLNYFIFSSVLEQG